MGVTLLGLMVSVHFQLSEALFVATRAFEHLDLDEWPAALLVLSMSLIWMSWNRYRHASLELQARRAAEARLEQVLSENRRLAGEAIRLQEAERKHLARELHDEMGQYLNVIKIDAVAIQETVPGETSFITHAAGAIIRNVDHVHRTISGMISRLRPVGLDELGLSDAIEHCIDLWRERTPGIHWSLRVVGRFEDLGEPLTLTVYRLVQEGLTNASKHSKASEVRVILRRLAAGHLEEDEVLLSVADDGCGMDTAAAVSGFGLSGMRERTLMSGGVFNLTSAPGGGLEITARLPAKGARI